MFFVRFRGTRNGEWVQAENMLSAKWVFARKYGLQSIAYIQAHIRKPPGL